MSRIEAVIFDWAGTTVDYGCFAPVQAFKTAFENYGITLSDDEIRKPMGLLKIDHIRELLELPHVKKKFKELYDRLYDEVDVKAIYAIFESELLESICNFTKLKPHVIETTTWLREKNIKIGSTTGYTDQMMEEIVLDAEKQGYIPDAWVSPDSTNAKGRPHPDMIYKNMEMMHIFDPSTIIKVGDTIADIREGKNAGTVSIGVLEGSSLIGLKEEEFKHLPVNEQDKVLKKAREEYLNAGADYVIHDLKELISIINSLDTTV